MLCLVVVVEAEGSQEKGEGPEPPSDQGRGGDAREDQGGDESHDTAPPPAHKHQPPPLFVCSFSAGGWGPLHAPHFRAF